MLSLLKGRLTGRAGIRFVVLSFTCVIALALAMGTALSMLLTRAVAQWEWENTAAFVRRDVEMADLAPLFAGPQGPQERERWGRELSRLFADFPEIVRVKVWDPNARVLWSDEERLIGQLFPDNGELRDALAGKISVKIKPLTGREHTYERREFATLAEVYVPIVSRQTGEVVGVVEVYKTPVRLFTTMRVGRFVIWTISIVGALTLYLMLVPLVRQAYGQEIRERTLQAYAGQLEQQVAQRTQELQAQREALHQAEKVAVMGQLLAGVAHELNNPLTTIIGYTGLLQRHAEAGSVAAGNLGKIAYAAERCARIVRNFLALARQYPPERQQVWLNAVVEGAADLVAYALRVDSVELHLQLSPAVPQMWADPHQLQQVVINLLTNAHQAVRHAPPPRRVTITTQYDAQRERLSLEVADTGPGVSPEILSRIFDPFFTTKPPGEGTGLGLSLCQGIIEGHGGTIRLQSAPSRGATFVVELRRGNPPAVSPAAPAVPATSPPRTATILVVDDEPDVASLLADLLKDDGHRVDVVSSGAEALQAAQGQPYDVILTDVKMPGLDGRGLYEQLERTCPGLQHRIVFITGDTMAAATRDFLAETGARSLSKPFEPAEIRQVILDVSAQPATNGAASLRQS
jgi:signal transduction histidine kinase/CheY-like chemotaxis protein